MRRVEWDNDLANRILPCDYFHMMAGVGTGGIIVVLLAILRMNTKDAIGELVDIWKTIYMDESLNQTSRSEKLATRLKRLLEQKGMSGDQKMLVDHEEDAGCKVFLCGSPRANLGVCTKFRNYKSRETSLNPTIVEAVLGTCAVPTLFDPIDVASGGCRIAFTTGSYNFNNPSWEMIKEACDHFGQNHYVASILSLGCCFRKMPNAGAIDKQCPSHLVAETASDPELVDRDLGWRVGKSSTYQRLFLDDGFPSTGDSFETVVGCIAADTDVYLSQQSITEKVNECVFAAERPGKTLLKNIAGLDDECSASAHGLPLLSAFFVERPTLIKKMMESLFRRGPTVQRRMVLSGLGGVGKTQIVINFMHQFLSRFRHILFIDGGSVQSIESGIIRKVKSLGAAYSVTTTEDALDTLANPDREISREWMIIYDNVDDPTIDIARYFPQCDFGTIIITTRNPNLGNLTPTAHLALEIMSEGEAVDVLLRSAVGSSRTPTDSDQRHAKAIANILGYLPVALVQAGYFIKVHDCMEDYIQRLLSRRPQILSRPAEAQLDKHYHGIYAALDVTWPHLSDRAQGFLSILGFVNYTGFPIVLIHRAAVCGFSFDPYSSFSRPSLFGQTVQLLGSILQAVGGWSTYFQQSVKLLCDVFRPGVVGHEQEVDDLVAELEQYSLVTRMTTFMVTTLRLHPLVHAWIHDRLSQQDQEMYFHAAVRLLVCGTNEENEDIFEFIYPHLATFTTRLSELSVNDRAGCATIFTHQRDYNTSISLWETIHADTIAQYGVHDLRTSEAKLQLACVYWKSPDMKHKRSALRMGDEAIYSRTRAFGPDDSMTITAVVRQARAMAQHGYGYASIPKLRRALEFWQHRPGENFNSIIEAKMALGFALCVNMENRQDDVEEATFIFKEVLQSTIDRHGHDHPATVEAAEALARASDLRKRSEDVDTTTATSVTDLWSFVVNARTKRSGMHHHATLAAMESLAESYESQDQLGMALRGWKKVVTVRTQTQGPNHLDTLGAMTSMARLYTLQKEYKMAELHWREIVSLRKDTQGPLHEDTISAVKNLADLYRLCGWYDEAEGYQKEIALWSEVQDPKCEGALRAMDSLATLYTERRQYETAEAQLEGILAMKKAIHGPHHQDTITTVEKLALLYTVYTQYDEVDTLKKVISLWREVDPDNKGSFQAMESLATLYAERKQYEAAENQWNQVIAMRKSSQGSRHKDTLHAISELVKIYHLCCGDGEEVDRKQVDLHTRVHGPSLELALRVMESLAVLYTEREQYEAAETQWNQVIAVRKSRQGSLHEDTLKAVSGLVKVYRLCCSDIEEADRKQVDLQTRVHGPNLESALRVMETMAKAYTESMHHEKAEAIWRDIIGVKKVRRGPRHEDTIGAIEKLARLYTTSGWYDAVEAQQKVISIWGETQDPRYKRIIYAKESLVNIYLIREEYEEAEARWKDVIAIRKDVYGADHKYTNLATQQLASFYTKCKQYGTVEAHQKVVELWKEVQGPSHEVTLLAMEVLAAVYATCEQWEAAEAQWSQVIALQKEKQGPSHEDTLYAVNQLLELYGRCCTDEVATGRKRVALQREAHGPRHEFTLQSMESLAALYADHRQYDEAEAQWKVVIALRNKGKGSTHHASLSARKRLARMYSLCGKYGDAELQWEKVVSRIKPESGLGHQDTTGILTQLAKMYTAWGRYDAAEALWKEMIEVETRLLGSRHWRTRSRMYKLARLYERAEKFVEAEDVLSKAVGPEDEDGMPSDKIAASLQRIRSLLLMGYCGDH